MRILLKDWARWKRICSVSECPPDSVARFAKYLHAITGKFFRAYSIRPDFYPSDSEEAWKEAVSIFDTWILGGIDGTKPQKNVMIKRGLDAGRDTIKLLKYYNTNAYLLQRDAVKNLLRKEGFLREKVSTINAFSLDAPLGKGSKKEKTGMDITPSSLLEPADDVSMQELKVLAESGAKELLGRLDRTEKLFALTRLLALPCTINPVLSEALGVKKSSLGEKAKQSEITIRNFPREVFPESSASEHYLYARYLLKSLYPLLLGWGEGDEAGRALMRQAERKDSYE